MMKKYPKIQSLFKRDPKNKNRFIMGQWATPELEFLQNNVWDFTEKVDGTNIRIRFDGKGREFGGKTENAQIPAHLYKKLEQFFPEDLLGSVFPDLNVGTVVMLYGEGYGHKIQKAGRLYIPKSTEPDFVLFDVQIGDWWLKRDSVDEIASKLNIKSVPIIGEGTLRDAISLMQLGFKSRWGDFNAEGLVARPRIELFARDSSRIITKVKEKDFLHL